MTHPAAKSPAPTSTDPVLEALRALPDGPWQDITPRVMDRIRAESDAETESVVSALRALPPIEGRDLTSGVMTAIHRIELHRRRLFFLYRGAAAAACAVLFLGIGLWKRETVVSVSEPQTALASIDLSTPSAAAAWLLEAQQPNGGWDTTALGGRPEHQPALTALGLLALHRQAPAANREAVLCGAEKLCDFQNHDGSFGRGDAVRINQGLVTAVLLELNQSLHSDALGESLASALSFSRRMSTQRDGFWGYTAEASDGTLFASGLPLRHGTATPEALNAELKLLLRHGTEASHNRFYQNCLVALSL